MKSKIIIEPAWTKQRLDKILLLQFPQYSRAYIKNQIKLGNFLIGGKKVKPSYIRRQGDIVAPAPGFILPQPGQILPNPDIKLKIIYEDENVIVLDKPAGLAVHPRQNKNGLPLPQEIDSTLVSGLLAYYPAIKNVGDNPPSPLLRQGFGGHVRPGIVHRLDKDTSGVMIIAKNQNSFDWLKKQFKERKTIKKYLALVHGSLKNKKGEIKTLLHRAKKDPTKQKVSTKEGREAITQYKIIQEFKNYTLLEASPKTGRLHQIRVQFAWLGHPVVGDTKYGSKKLPTPPGLARQFLHAKELKITLPDGQEKTFNAPIPTNLQVILHALEKI